MLQVELEISLFIFQKTKSSKGNDCDRNENMLNEGKRRLNVGKSTDLEWVCGDAMKLPFENEVFDYYTISFGIRNVLDLKCLSEALEF